MQPLKLIIEPFLILDALVLQYLYPIGIIAFVIIALKAARNPFFRRAFYYLATAGILHFIAHMGSLVFFTSAHFMSEQQLNVFNAINIIVVRSIEIAGIIVFLIGFILLTGAIRKHAYLPRDS